MTISSRRIQRFAKMLSLSMDVRSYLFWKKTTPKTDDSEKLAGEVHGAGRARQAPRTSFAAELASLLAAELLLPRTIWAKFGFLKGKLSTN